MMRSKPQMCKYISMNISKNTNEMPFINIKTCNKDSILRFYQIISDLLDKIVLVKIFTSKICPMDNIS